MTHFFVTPACQAWDTGPQKSVKVMFVQYLQILTMEFFFFEALTLLSALSHVCESAYPKSQCLAILTNSLNTFDMFNTLHTLPAYNTNLITASDLLLQSNIQLQVFHIPR